MKKKIRYIYLGFLLVVPVIILFLPPDYFDKGQSFCLSVLLFNKTCYGCGMTRAIQHLIHFDMEGAAAFNKLSFITLPVLVYVWAKEILKSYRIILPHSPEK